MSKTTNLLNRNWSLLQKPSDCYLVKVKNNYSKFKVEPLEKGFGITLGNALRRILLSSLQGYGVIGIRIPNIKHEYSTIPGIREEVSDIILNLKLLVLRNDSGEQKRLRIAAKGPCVVTAQMIESVSGIEIINPNQIILHIEEETDFEMDIFIAPGNGYSSAEENSEKYPLPNETIYIDTKFSPIEMVSYKVEDSRVGKNTDFDRLYIELETDGSLAPDIALGIAAKIMQEQLQIFIGFNVNEPEKEDEARKLPFPTQLLTKIENLELSVRSQNCLKNENIMYVGDLVTKTESKMLQTPNFGKKSLNEIKALLNKMGLHFGMDVKEWPPTNIEELVKKYEEDQII